LNRFEANWRLTNFFVGLRNMFGNGYGLEQKCTRSLFGVQGMQYDGNCVGYELKQEIIKNKNLYFQNR
jgi:hypothetical protein